MSRITDNRAGKKPGRNTLLMLWMVALLIAALIVVEYVLDAQRQYANTPRQWLFLVVGILALGSAIFATRVLQRENKLQEDTASAAEAELERLQTIIENLPVVVRLLSAPNGDVLIQNRIAEELFPTETWNSMKPSERLLYYGFRKAGGSPMTVEDAPVLRSLQDGVAIRDYELQITRPETGTRILLTSTAPLRGEKGSITAVVTVMQDVTEMKQLDQRKDEFIATAAHELRSPLTTISGYQQLLIKMIENTEAPPKVPIYLAAMGTQVTRLNALVERLLDASRIQLGRLTLEKSRFDLADLARSAASAMTTSSDGHPVTVTAPNGAVEGEWDVTRIEQALTNLVSNAVRYSPPNEPVEIVVEKRDGNAHVRVIDRGPGVPPEQRATLFDRYSQGGSQGGASGLRKRGALGLGLYLSSEIIKAHNGTIGMEPNPEGGSVFWFTLP